MPFEHRPTFVHRPTPRRSITQEFPTTVIPNQTAESEDEMRIITPLGTNMIAGVGINANAASTTRNIGGA